MPTIPIDPNAPLPATSLIKIPRQPRSIAMVHCILNAGIEIIRDNGLQSMTTNKVADRAGVGIGSLYQYFSNKESILAGIIERSLLEVEQILQKFLAMNIDIDADTLLRSGLVVMLRYYDSYPNVIKPILREAPLLAQGSAAVLIERLLTDFLQAYLLHNSHRYRIRRGYAGMYVTVNAMIYIFMKWTVDPSPMLTEEKLVDAMMDQMMSAVEVIEPTQ
ncbi:TetR/AcrR family transcriptional regulator [Veronia pacifica]|uniref:HTH tetR-type domain-containing protein n=1 Tax=Veronia pacifica TaxID=1080227 RepID=A0A1C3EQ93_9GAMM|nr:TetR/AcrR family transcriptional regulator [Veronia pacifica]ODA35352.1 hypothetical protein A8L45_04090 [Veronia pacifica]